MKTAVISFWLVSLLLVFGEANAREGRSSARTADPAAGVAASAEGIQPLRVGAEVSPLTLQTPAGKVFDLSAAIEKKPTILIFYRGGWCPYCNLQLGQLQIVESRLLDLGYQILTISPDGPAKLAESINKRKLTYTLLPIILKALDRYDGETP